ncbi:hypothetical protein SUGI_0846520 [Cryptomeria japonica]|nr:hypothetical protein SUGI_0846520 [Cryptomeria japonica]
MGTQILCEDNISKLVVGPLFIHGEFEELSLLEDFMVDLTFSGPAYEGVYMDEGIGDSPWFKRVDILGEAIDTLLPHDTLSECGAAHFSGFEVCMINGHDKF